MKTEFVLAGDVGATKTNLAVFAAGESPRQPVLSESLASASYPDLETLVTQFLARFDRPVRHACLGVAGPVVNGRARITRLPWQPSEATLRSRHGFRNARLINDLVATGYAIPLLREEEQYIVNAGEPEINGTIGIIAPGTGLGEALFTRDGGNYLPLASEGGHADYAPTTLQEMALLRFMLSRFEHVSYDRICSGQGLPYIYEFLKQSGEAEEPAWLAEELTGADDPAPLLVKYGLPSATNCELCSAALELFISILGAESGNLALRGLTTGGIYLGGGMPPRLLDLFKTDIFMRAFTRKGRLSGLAARIPVRIILKPEAALTGAARCALDMVRPDA